MCACVNERRRSDLKDTPKACKAAENLKCLRIEDIKFSHAIDLGNLNFSARSQVDRMFVSRDNADGILMFITSKKVSVTR